MITSIFLLVFFSLMKANSPDRSTPEPPWQSGAADSRQKNRENQITTRFSPGFMPRQFALPTIYMLLIIWLTSLASSAQGVTTISLPAMQNMSSG